MKRSATVCHIIDKDAILLKLSNDGISKGKWNAVGGKIEIGETPEECAIREAKEESGLKVSNLTYHGRLMFHSPEFEFEVFLFSTKTFSGNLTSSEEGELCWFPIPFIPYYRMWDDDMFWLRPMLAGYKFDADFIFDETATKIVSAVFTPLKDSDVAHISWKG